MKYQFLISLCFLFSSHLPVQSQPDSVYIEGQIKNLNGRLYRQNSAVTFFRNNILQPSTELISRAPLEADGSFKVALPLNFPTEEFYLEYGPLANTTFLGTKGKLNVTFDADSMGLSDKLFYFGGSLAAANNSLKAYLVAEGKAFEKNKSLGADFFDNFWYKSMPQATAALDARQQFRMEVLAEYSRHNLMDPNLRQWITTKAQVEKEVIWMDYLRSNDLDIGLSTINQNTINEAPLTAEKVTLAGKYSLYAHLKMEYLAYQNPGSRASLPVKTMAELIKNYNTDLNSEENQRLSGIIQGGVTDQREINFLSQLFARNEVALNTLFDYERESRLYSENLPENMTDFLKANYLTNRFTGFSLSQKRLLGQHILQDLKQDKFKNSLRELLALELHDSLNIRKFTDYRSNQIKPAEVVPGFWMSRSQEGGASWMKKLLAELKGETIYLAKWNITDSKSLEELSYMTNLENNLPENTVILYVHLSDMEPETDRSALAKQYVIRHNLKGIHVFIDNNQMIDLLLKFNPLEPGTFAIINPKGKYQTRNAPSPQRLDELLKMLQAANR
ncbi:hypothetical protein CLV98_10356 [Dyadobacter jejuensis]|uniref:Thioredoxin domain-containing protein n=1 Tax=Dyadobacter jejuensis TaxID=1082580 RepID=A0A316AM99_9BACT|nr:hypothetical protein [Dyadobacter jejuensis]PWJ58691.1 hypothetical protein CLV98_10356 [Dyadobacter jejuensis]